MEESDSVFGVELDRLKRLLTLGKDELGEEAERSASRTASLHSMTEKPGMQIGRYKLLNVLGEGGMGIVYLAEQEGQIRRKVALKVIKPGMDSKRVIARFETERQALALLDHPNIAQVYDAGTTESGRPYFVMEYVKGSPITEYCDHYKLSIQDRLVLFQEVCAGLQHAHQKGIVHRDIKPSNILVCAGGDKAIPKIIDFGVAKAIAAPLTERTAFTEDSHLLGTPEYMSPEQADMANADIDTRSDIYSLGVLLYVLLTGVMPFDSDTLRTGGIEHIRKAIRETDPQTPSTRLTELGDQARALAESRRTEVVALARCLQRELEWIPLKAIRKDRAERYRSAVELADDIENYLKGAPLLAGPLTARYRLRKFVRRNKSIFAAGAMVAAALVIGLAVSVVLLVREQHARRQAQANEMEKRQTAYASDVRMAQQALAMNDMGRAQRLLENCQPAPGEGDLRGWEWRYLWNECGDDALGELWRYPPQPFSVAYSRDGKMLAVGRGPISGVDIWDVPGRKLIKTLKPTRGHCCVFSPRGDLLATEWRTRGPKQIRLLRTDTWDCVDPGQLVLDDDDDALRALRFSPDGTRIAGLSHQGQLTVWETSQWAMVRDESGLKVEEFLGNLDFSPDGKALVIGECDGRLRVIDLVSGDAILDPWQAHPESVTSVAWSPNDTVIASGSGWSGGPIQLWNTSSGKSIGELPGHTSWITGLIFSEDGRLLYSSSGDQTIRIWDVERQQCLATHRGSGHEVLGLALSPDGTTLASACKDGVIAFWDAVPKPKEEMPRLIPLDKYACFAFSPDSRVLAVPQAGTVNLYDLTTPNKEPEQVSDLGTDVSTVAYSPDGTLLVSGSTKGKIRVWSCTDRCLVGRELDGDGRYIHWLRFRADGKRLFSFGWEGMAIWWDTLTWQKTASFEVGLRKWWEHKRWRRADVSPDGRLLAVAIEGGLRWLNAENGEMLKQTTDPNVSWPIGVAFSSDSLRAASADYYGTVALWDTSPLGFDTAFRGHLLGAHGAAFSPDSRRLATTGTSLDAVRLWDLSTRREILELSGKGTELGFVTFSPDGNWLAARDGKKNVVHLWRAPSWEEIEAEGKRLQSAQSL